MASVAVLQTQNDSLRSRIARTQYLRKTQIRLCVMYVGYIFATKTEGFKRTCLHTYRNIDTVYSCFNRVPTEGRCPRVGPRVPRRNTISVQTRILWNTPIHTATTAEAQQSTQQQAKRNTTFYPVVPKTLLYDSDTTSKIDNLNREHEPHPPEAKKGNQAVTKDTDLENI